MNNYYTGVGSRETPVPIIELMETLASIYSEKGWTLRSGGARGADSAFESKSAKSEIFLADIGEEVDRFIYDRAQRLAAMYHPAWSRLPNYARKLHTRNVFQVLGEDLKTPSNLVICWTKDGCINHNTRGLETGGTGTAISIAFYKDIPIINLARPEHTWQVNQFINNHNGGKDVSTEIGN